MKYDYTGGTITIDGTTAEISARIADNLERIGALMKQGEALTQEDLWQTALLLSQATTLARALSRALNDPDAEWGDEWEDGWNTIN